MTTKIGLQSEILWLGEASCEEVSVVGGKAANLSRLATHHAVPPGFCLTATAFPLGLQDGLPFHPEVASLPLLPPTLLNEVTNAYRTLGDRCGTEHPAVAIRSSAVDEDGCHTSFAGQHETYLNVVGAKAVVEAIKWCWMSAFLPRTFEYRRRHGLDQAKPCLAVLVQQLVVADVSTIVFSIDPVCGSRDEVIINSNWGLGESLVGGTVTPDIYRIRKADLTVTAHEISHKRRMTIACDGGTREVDVPRFLRVRPTLSEEQVIEVARLGIALETEMGWPVDVECAYRAGHLYLLQCRPITLLSTYTDS